MADLLALRARLALDDSEYERGLNAAGSKASSLGEKVSGIFGKIGAVASTAAKITVAGVSAASVAIGKLAHDSVTGYADYEQLVGGVQKLYGNMGQSLEEFAKANGKSVDEVRDQWEKLDKAQSIVLKNAKNAYKTAGMNANEYMETATSFSASLINSLSGDTIKAAELTDKAMVAIADNFNTFGGDIGMIQSAFQGFAKQNYTMLDNLKLGYGGTKEEMERLIDDANKYAKSIGEASDLSVDSFADIITAIDLIQQKQNIAGTTMREGSSTIAGSIMTVKAAWQNLVTGFSDSDADLEELIDNVVSSASTALNNLIPVIEKSIKGIGTFISEVAPTLVKEVPKLITDIAPDIIKVGISLMSSIKDGIIDAASSIDLLGVILPLLVGLSGKIREKSREFVAAGIEILRGLGQGMEKGIDTISTPIITILTNLAGIITDNAPVLFDVAKEMLMSLATGISEGLPEFLENTALPMLLQFSEMIREGAGSLVDLGIELILKLAQGIIDSLPTLLEQLPQIVINIAGVINDNAPKLIAGGIRLIQMLISGIINAVPTLIANFPQIFQAILAVWSALNWIDLGTKVINFIKTGIQNLSTQIPNTLKSIGNKAIEFFKSVNWANTGAQVINFIKSGVMGLFSAIPSALTSIGNAAVGAFKSINWFDLGANIIRGIVNGISSNVGAIIDAARDAARRAFEAAKDFLGIKSPSRLFRDQVGAMIPKGLAAGIEEETPTAIDSAESLARKTFLPFDDINIPSVNASRSEGEIEILSILSAILAFLQANWPAGEPVPTIFGGETVGYYDKQLGVRAQMRRRGVI